MRFAAALGILVLWGCTHNRSNLPTQFTNITPSSGIAFSNTLTITDQLNPYTYRNFYNGAGVAIGDLNNDGLQDIYFAGNQVDNKLYINQGEMQFLDVTESAGVACHGVWSSGVTLVDINADGWLDIYVCKSGSPDTPHRNNELFINQHNLTFTEESEKYGLDILGLSVQASFFDYDKDGDLDCYLLTNSVRSVGSYDLIKDQREIPDPQGAGNKFLRNEGGKFVDFSEQAGIYRSTIGFGLGITLGDFNEDSWTDIFVSNDFFERDYLYINNQQGGFKESLTEYFQSISMGSMGADFADLDNDGNPELFVTEMLPDSLNRRKSKTVYEDWNKYQLDLKSGYYHQFPRNVLQKKIGANSYAEVSRLSGVAASEWSWGALLFDMDNDGLRDIFIANGIYKDLLDRDYLAYTGVPENVRSIMKDKEKALVKLMEIMPSSTFPNYAYKNLGNLEFKNMAATWGLGEPMYSSGSAYGDLDNDGDLDLVVNNINAPSIVYGNNTDTTNFRSLSISVSSDGQNSMEVGTHVVAFCGDRRFTGDNFVTRGFQSSVQPRITLGLGSEILNIDSLYLYWPEGGITRLLNLLPNKHLHITKSSEAVINPPVTEYAALKWKPAMVQVSGPLFRHHNSKLVDMNRERLLPWMYSHESPKLVAGDIDGDAVPELYVGGGRDQASVFVRFRKDRGFYPFTPSSLEAEKQSEETQGTLADLDGDGDLDLYVACGGRSFSSASDALVDRIYFNDGEGNFSQSDKALPKGNAFATSVVKTIDFDQDGDLDLAVGERFDPFTYGVGGRAYIYENNGKGQFSDVTSQVAPALVSVGMITDMQAVDIDGDGWTDLVLAGDWSAVQLFRNDHGLFKDITPEMGLQTTSGWWHAIVTADFNQDGKPDFVVGNHGRNSFFKEGDRMYVGDFDKNGSIEQLFCTQISGKYFPVADKDELISQIPSLKKSILYYKDYSRKAIDDLFPEDVLGKARVYQVDKLSSVLLLSGPDGYSVVDLPMEAQYSPIYALKVVDFNSDGVLDLVAGGNQFAVKPQFGRYDASNGWLFRGKIVNSSFTFENGIDLHIGGEIRSIEEIKINTTRYLAFAKHDDELEIYEIPD